VVIKRDKLWKRAHENKEKWSIFKSQKVMGVFNIKMDGNQPYMDELTSSKLKAKKSKTKSVSVKLSANVLREMKKVAGIKNDVSDGTILYAYITKTLQNA